METQVKKDERIEIRISDQDKKIFRKAQKLSGDKTFSSFVIRAIRIHAEHIISKEELILASKRDREIFFDAVFGDHVPNNQLIAAAKRYRLKAASG
ncbi:MAG: DUF1778 domain-containing protein [Bacteroidales bacterium]|nr:DUF1778 domain-containing protein [Bacteroidales bacterium]